MTRKKIHPTTAHCKSLQYLHTHNMLKLFFQAKIAARDGPTLETVTANPSRREK